MKLIRVRICNFRCFTSPIELEIGDFTALIGKNDAGKSSIFEALDIFFNDSKLEQDDASVFGNPTEVSITCTFEEVPSAIVIDSTNVTSLKDEYLLDENGMLVITKKYNASLRAPKLKGVFLTAFHPSVEDADNLLELKNSELKQRARKRDINLKDIRQTINAELREAIRQSFDDLCLSVQDIPISEEGDAKKIWDKLKEILPAYFLFKADRPSTDQDAEAQDPMKAAIKLAIDERRDDLDKIAVYVDKRVGETIDRTLAKVRDLDEGLADELSPEFDAPRWLSVFKVALKSDDGISINKRGSGVRRIVLLGFLQAQAEESLVRDQSVIYAVEEPETSQHPDNQRALYGALEELSRAERSQVIVTTHTPTLGRLLPIDSLRYLEIAEDGRRIVREGDSETLVLISQSLGVIADHDVKLFVGVEGGNDIKFLKGISQTLREHGEDIVDLTKLEDEGILIFVPLGGSNLSLWISRLKGLSRPELYLFDRDTEPPAAAKYNKEVEELEAQSNCHTIMTSKREIENYLHEDVVNSKLDINISYGDFDDVPELVAKALHDKSESPHLWRELSEEKKGKKVSRAKQRLNGECVLEMTPSLLDLRDPSGDIRSWLLTMQELIDE